MYRIKDSDFKPFKSEWIKYYEENNINMRSVVKDDHYWWDTEILNYFDEYGNEYFKYEKIWDIDWVKAGNRINRVPENYRDPRGIILKLVHFWLEITKKYENRYVNKIDSILSSILKSKH